MVNISNSMREEGMNTLSQVKDKSTYKDAWKREERMDLQGPTIITARGILGREEMRGGGRAVDHKELWILTLSLE